MTGNVRLSIAVGLAALSVLGLGCGGDQATVRITERHAAALGIAPSIRRVAVATFLGPAGREAAWGRALANDLTVMLADPTGRYELTGPAAVAAYLDEAAPGGPGGPGGPDSARRIGKRAGVDAVLYGTVAVAVSETSPGHPETGPGVRSNSRRPARRTALCRASVRFVMDEVATGRTVAAVLLTKEARIPREGAADGDEAVRDLLRRCAAEFVATISPSSVDFVVVLDAGDGKIVAEGNALTREGKYNEALARYETALAQEPGNAGAAFNAGLMHEKNRRYARALVMYDRAWRLVQSDKYKQARDRIAGRSR